MALPVVYRRKVGRDLARADGWYVGQRAGRDFANKMQNIAQPVDGGHETLDILALDVLQNGKTTVPSPAHMHGREFSIDVPVIFNLDNPSSGEPNPHVFIAFTLVEETMA